MTQSSRVTIIEDDEPLRSALIGLVRSLGYEAAGYASAEDFMNLEGPASADCVITDLHLPGKSGIELICVLRSAGLTMPVIAITGRTEVGLDERAVACGALCLLKKPFEFGALAERLQEALS